MFEFTKLISGTEKQIWSMAQSREEVKRGATEETGNWKLSYRELVELGRRSTYMVAKSQDLLFFKD